MDNPDSGPRSGDPNAVANTGGIDVIRALTTQIKPPFMLPAIGTATFGALSASALHAPMAGAVHILCVSVALYVAHLRDERVDAYLRGEEEPSVPEGLLRVATILGTGLFVLALAGVWYLAGSLGAVLTLPLIGLSWLHAPYLDTNPVTVSTDYPAAIALVITWGYVVQTGRIEGPIVWAAAAISVTLIGATITLDRIDRQFDEGIDKRTVPVIVGDARAAGLSSLALCVGGSIVFAGVTVGVFSTVAVASGAIAFATALAAVRRSPDRPPGSRWSAHTRSSCCCFSRCVWETDVQY